MQRFLVFALIFLSFVLNFFQLEKIPPGLSLDEASIGVNAYLILTTGKDEHGVSFPLFFKAFGEYKLPLYIYLTSLSMFFLGKNELAIRLPSAFLGSLIPLTFYLFLKNIISKKTALLASFILTTSPWFLQFCGPAFEATVALFFFLLGSYFFLLFFRKKRLVFLFFGLFTYILTLFTYNSYRLITPLTLIFIFFYLNPTFKNRLIFTTIFLVTCLSLFISLFSKEANIRFSQTSIFHNQNSLFAPFIFLKNYLTYFSWEFLFLSGDGIGRHQIPNFGLFPKWQFFFLLLGFFSLLRLKRHDFFLKIFFGTIIFAPFPAALAFPSPHSLRSLFMVLPYTFFISIGLLKIINKFKSKKLLLPLLGFLTLIFVYSFSFYLHYYFFHYPKTNLLDWGGNYKELVKTTKKYKNQYKIVALTNHLPQAYIYFRFYGEEINTIPANLLKTKKKETNEPILLVTGYLDERSTKPSDKLLETIYLPNDNKDGFAQLWEI